MRMSPMGGPGGRRGTVSLNVGHPSRFPAWPQRPGRTPSCRKRQLPLTVPVAIRSLPPYVQPMKSGDLGHSEEHRRLEGAIEIAGLGEFEWDLAGGVLVVSERMAAIT